MRQLVNPNLPWPARVQTQDDLVRFANDLVKYLQTYLADMAFRANGALPKDGTEPMTGALNLAAFGLTTTGAINAATLVASTNVTTPLVTTPAVSFPATQIPNAGANVLDDYEEGSTSGNMTATSGTFTTATYTLVYTKIGRQVIWNANFTITTVGTATGTLSLPLPFTAASSGGVSGFRLTGTPIGLTGYVAAGTAVALIAIAAGTTAIAVGNAIIGGSYAV